ncbi:MAG TPA: hypothetical protein VFY49_18770 [Myxococcota bacterium]|nr:hypothetical protein [Myxococcota bacterium]
MHELDDPARVDALRRLIRSKPALERWYRECYAKCAACVGRCPARGDVLELGSGAGFPARRGTAQRWRVFFVSIFLAFTLLVFLYRVYLERSWLPFHYFLPATGILAVFFGAATARMLRGLTRSWPVAVAAGALWLLLIHGLAIYTVVDSRLRDIAVYQELRPTFEWIARLAPQQRIGVHAEVFATPEFASKVASLHTIVLPLPTEKADGSSVRQEFESLFVPIPADQAAGFTGGFFAPALGTEVFAVEVREAPPAAASP